MYHYVVLFSPILNKKGADISGWIMKILVADDSKTGLAILTAALKKLGHEVFGATSGAQAIELFKEMQPNFVILDVVMQNMNGFECAKNLRQIGSKDWIPIIFLSASVDDDSIAQGIDAGGDDYLAKPFSDITLAAKIKAMQRIADMQKKLTDTAEKLSVLSTTDMLTGIDNRFQFNRVIKAQLAYARRYQIKLALLFLDVDHFKEINDHLGHQTGDLLLQEIAQRLKMCIRSYDFLARLGGDEFAIILNKIESPQDADTVAQKILDKLQPAYKLNNNNVHISCSIGVVCYPASGITPDILIQHADIAMYYAKELGRNNFQHYTAELQSKQKHRFSLESALRVAVENNELYMCYQPIYKLNPFKLVGMEALMRWNSPLLGLVLPDTFIPIAEDIGIITLMGEWALRDVCKQAARWYDEGYQEFKIAINISLRQLLHTDFVQVVKDVLRETQVKPDLLEFELTESTIMIASPTVENIIKNISKMNIGLSLDDFGTGYSSLSHLKRIPINALKIDKSFVLDVNKDPNDALIVKAIVALGKTLKLNLIAEGIENDAQLQFLKANHCEYGQGFYLSQPLAPVEMGLLLEQENKNEQKK